MKSLLFVVMVSLFLTGCCCLSSSPTCPTYTQSCEKSCAGEASGCVDSCKSALRENGIEPDSCCPSSMTVRGIFESTCQSESDSSFSSTEECVNYMVSEYYNDFGLGPDDCTIGA